MGSGSWHCSMRERGLGAERMSLSCIHTSATDRMYPASGLSPQGAYQQPAGARATSRHDACFVRMHILGLLPRWHTISAAPMDGAMLHTLILWVCFCLAGLLMMTLMCTTALVAPPTHLPTGCRTAGYATCCVPRSLCSSCIL
jgi:hypothetical protein